MKKIFDSKNVLLWSIVVFVIIFSILIITLLFVVFQNKNTLVVQDQILVEDSIIEIDSILSQKDLLDTTSQNILLIGDSQAYFLMKGLKRYTSINKHKLYAVAWVSANFDIFAKTDTLLYFLETIQPTYVIVSLGTNQMPIKDTIKLNADIETIIDVLSNYKTIWIGPLKRRHSIGLNEILESKIDSNCFFRSDTLTIARKTGSWAHPSSRGSNMWTDSIAHWIVNKSKFPIKLEITEKKADYKFTKNVLKPFE